MLDFEEFKPVELGSGPCSLTLTLNSIIFSRGLMERLKRPEYVRVAINENTKQLIVRVTDSSDTFAVDLSRMPLRGRVNNRDFVKKLKIITGFTEEDTVKIPGKYVPEYELVLFDLNDAVLAVSDI